MTDTMRVRDAARQLGLRVVDLVELADAGQLTLRRQQGDAQLHVAVADVERLGRERTEESS